MRTVFIILLFSIVFLSFQENIPKHFEDSKKLSFKEIHLNCKTDTVKRTTVLSASLKKVKGLSDVTIRISSRDQDDNKIEVNLYRNKKKLAHFSTTAFNTLYLYANDQIEFADIDGNGFIDLKFSTVSGGCGLGGELTSKVYLMNKNDTSFTCFSFSDFALDNEFDLNNDGNYEIISKQYNNYKGHAYWVYNTFNFKNDSLINNSKEFNYPLWTRYLNYSENKIAKGISLKEMNNSFIKAPDGFYISGK